MKDYKKISKVIFFLFIFILSSSSFAARFTNEGFFVFDAKKEHLNTFKAHSDLTIDLVSTTGFEVYGPVGTEVWLQDLGVQYFNLVQGDKTVNGYPEPEQISEELVRLASEYSHIAKIFKIGESERGRDLLFIKISDNPEIDEVEPEVKYIGNMHGNEIANRDVLLKFVEYLLTSYGKNEEITNFINSTELWIMVSMNPDGAAMKRRGNGRWIDLNRDFPDFTTSDNSNTPEGRAIETKAVMAFQSERNFALSANFHGGAVCVNYPWDTTSARPPLLNFVVEISKEYAAKIPEMANSYQFEDGVTNGYDWYEVDGGMQDWSFYWHGDLQVTIEMHNYKWPNYSMVQKYYNEHKDSLFAFLKRIHQGAGFYFDDPTVEGRVSIFKVEKNYTALKSDIGNFSFKHGEFFKVLESGSYEFIIETKTRGNHHFKMDVEASRTYDNGNFKRLN